jgi:HEPN domain-containing protein/predicted nucleotidyltransferase
MTNSLDHLDEPTRAKLLAITAKIREVAPAEIVLLFGSYARGNWVVDRVTGYRSDFDLLVIVASASDAETLRLESDITDAIRPLAEPVPVSVIVHDTKQINHEIRRGQYFFADIAREGVVLHDSRRFALAKPKTATPEERKALAEEYFNHWFTSAGQFFETHEFCITRKAWSVAAFELHQATERYYAAALLVFTGYKPTTHNIEALGEMVAALHPDLAVPIPMTDPDDERLFKLLKRAYIEARYSMKYRITPEELAILGERVRDVAARIERLCREQIASFVPEP